MTDAVKVGFVPFSAAARGVLVVFCDDALKFGPVTGRALGAAAHVVKRAAANRFKGKSGTALDILAPANLGVDLISNWDWEALVPGAGPPPKAMEPGGYVTLEDE